MKKSLAIVIPAYSARYLDETLASLSRQTDRSFGLYVGDDCSPEDIKAVVDRYSSRLDIRYTRFGENFGREDLVRHWKRCVDLARTEEWVWLFSDDDVLQSDCVRRFMEADIPEGVDVVHFNLTVIDGEGRTKRETPRYPPLLSPADFFNRLYRRQIDARMPEFVFRSSALRGKGFVNFDLAWRSDNATVMSLACPNGILTVSGERCRVLWRDSGRNISTPNTHLLRKNSSTVGFFNWVSSFFLSNGIVPPMSKAYFIKTLVFQLEYRGWRDFIADCIRAAGRSSYAGWAEKPLFVILAFYRLIYRKFE